MAVKVELQYLHKNLCLSNNKIVSKFPTRVVLILQFFLNPYLIIVSGLDSYKQPQLGQTSGV